MKIFHVCGNQGNRTGASGIFLDLSDLFGKGFRRDGRDHGVAGMRRRREFSDSCDFFEGFVLIHFFICSVDQILHHEVVILETDFISNGIA